jgi:hydroxymethylbilane synthase
MSTPACESCRRASSTGSCSPQPACAAWDAKPAAGQGSLALEARRVDSTAAQRAASISDHDALVELTAERAAVATLGATCHTPVGICARLEPEELTILGFAGLPDGSEWIRDRVAGDPEQPAELGRALAERLLAAGAAELLERAEALA